MTNQPKRPLAGDDDSWGKLASDLFGIEFGVDDELDLPDPDELNESAPVAAKIEETPVVAPVVSAPVVAQTAPRPAPPTKRKPPADGFGGELFGDDLHEEQEEDVEPAKLAPVAPRPALESDEEDDEDDDELIEEEAFPMTVAEQGDDYWDALESWSWDETSGRSREGRPQDLLKTLEAEVSQNSRHARSRADSPAPAPRGRSREVRPAAEDGDSRTTAPRTSSRRPSSSSSSQGGGRSRSRDDSGRDRPASGEERAPRESRSREPRERTPERRPVPQVAAERGPIAERPPTVERTPIVERDDDFGFGLNEPAAVVERPAPRRAPRPVSQPRRPVPAEPLADDDAFGEMPAEVDDVAFVSETSDEFETTETSEDGEVRRRRRRRRRRRPGGRPGEAPQEASAGEEFGVDSDELEEHVTESRTPAPDAPARDFVPRDPSLREPSASRGDRPRSDRSRSDRPRRDAARTDQPPRATVAAEAGERPARSPRSEESRSDAPRPRRAPQEVGERDNEFVDEPRRRSHKPVTDENYSERHPRDLEVPPSRRPTPVASTVTEDASADPITPANYDDIPTWEEAIGMLVKTPPGGGDRGSRPPRRDDNRRDDRPRR